MLKCKQCGKEFRPWPGDVKRGYGKFCGVSCYGKWQTENSTGKNARGWEGKSVEVSCGWCEKKYLFNKKHYDRGNGKFCSRACLGKWWSKNKAGKNAPGWKGGRVPQQSLVRNSERYGVWRRMVFTRDNFTCRHCGKSVSGHMEAHHIKRFSVLVKEAAAVFPELSIYDACLSYAPLWSIDNGLTLCDKCHEKIPTSK